MRISYWSSERVLFRSPDATGGSSRSGPARRPVRQRPSSRDGLLPEVLQRMEKSGTHISIDASARARGQAFCPFPQNNRAVLASRACPYGFRSRRGGAISSPARLPLPFTTAITRAARSEEHTSELQSLLRISYAAFGLKN